MPDLQILSTAYDDLLKPGYVIEVDQDEAEELGAFEETALTLADAIDASLDPKEV